MHKQLQAIITVLSLINPAICAAMFARADEKLTAFPEVELALVLAASIIKEDVEPIGCV
jgi:hypothetical protein